jgi:hypothetical protein
MDAVRSPRTISRSSFIGRAVLAVATALIVLLALDTPASAAASWQWWNTDTDGYWDMATLDADFNGRNENNWFDLDNDGWLDTNLWNSRGADNFLESATFDMNEDGRREIWLSDIDGLVGFDVAYFDDNGDGYYERSAYLAQNSNSSFGTIGGSSGNLVNTLITMRTTDGSSVLSCGYQYSGGTSCNF